MLWTETSGANFSGIRGEGHVDCVVDQWPLVAGTYTVDLWCTVRGQIADWLHYAAEVNVEDAGYFSKGKPLAPGHPPVVVPHRWLAG